MEFSGKNDNKLIKNITKLAKKLQKQDFNIEFSQKCQLIGMADILSPAQKANRKKFIDDYIAKFIHK